jgi:hypothetical protein
MPSDADEKHRMAPILKTRQNQNVRAGLSEQLSNHLRDSKFLIVPGQERSLPAASNAEPCSVTTSPTGHTLHESDHDGAIRNRLHRRA